MSDEVDKSVQEDERLLLRSLSHLLENPRGPRRISEEAVASLLSHQVDYIQEVATEAVRLARSEGLHDVGETHVVKANQHVRSSKRRPIAEVIGGLAGGSGIAVYVDYTNVPSGTLVPWIVALLVISAISFTIAWVRRP